MRYLRNCLILLPALFLVACASQPQLEGDAEPGFTIDELKQQAELASYAGAHRDALMQYQKILAKKPGNVAALIGIGESLLAAAKPKRAEIYFERVLKSQPLHLMAREGRALSWLMQGNYSAARKTLENLVDDGVQRWRVWNGLGVIADLDGDYANAATHYQMAIAMESDKAILHNNLGYSQIMGHDYTSAEVSLNKALLLAPGNTRIVNNLSLSLAWQGKYIEAVEHLKRVMDEASSYNNVGYVAYLNADYVIAEDYFRTAMRLKPTFYKRAATNLELTLHKKNHTDDRSLQ